MNYKKLGLVYFVNVFINQCNITLTILKHVFQHTLTPDERIAYAEYVIPDEAMQGKFMDAWIPLSGKQGEGKEGSINITIYIRVSERTLKEHFQ